jgi:hypothetical protein
MVSTSTNDVGRLVPMITEDESLTFSSVCTSVEDVETLDSVSVCFNPFVTRPTISEKTSPSLLASLDQNSDKSFSPCGTVVLVVCAVCSSVIVEYPLVQDA